MATATSSAAAKLSRLAAPDGGQQHASMHRRRAAIQAPEVPLHQRHQRGGDGGRGAVSHQQWRECHGRGMVIDESQVNEDEGDG